MFEVFGEFDSAEEINKAAAGQLAQGDTQAIRDIARENGLDSADAEDYIAGDVTELCNPLMAALGKIKVEEDELKPVEIVQDWVNYIKAQATEHSDMAIEVRKKGKTVKGCIAELLKWSYKNCYVVDKDIVKAAGIGVTVKMGIPGIGHAYEIIKAYYLGGK
nr:MAG TPA: PcfK-like protein [Caudoviricetes sp.]